MSAHTPGPWAVMQGEVARWGRFIRKPDGSHLAYCDGGFDEACANAARIVACVNACEGMEDPDAAMHAAAQRYASVCAERDALAAALRDLVNLSAEREVLKTVNNLRMLTEAHERARAALAKVRS